LSGIFLKNQKDCGQAAMTGSDNAVALLMTALAAAHFCEVLKMFDGVSDLLQLYSAVLYSGNSPFPL
jgi:hypothetical protein